MKTTSKILAVLFLVIFAATTAVAIEGTAKDSKKGKYLYKKNCKSCHTKPANSKTMAQWQRIYDSGEHKGGAKAWEKMSKEDLHQIFFYLYDHAADSAQPETCG